MMSSQKQDLLYRLRAERKHLLQILSELSDFERETLLVTEKWTVRDVLAHLAGWAVWDLHAIQQMIETGCVDFFPITNVDAFNAQNVADRSNRTWEQLVDEMEQAQADWLELLTTLSDEDLFVSTRFRSPEWETLADWVQIALEHEAEHARAIQGWLESREAYSERDYSEHAA